MNIPRFNAEASLYQASGCYCEPGSHNKSAGTVQPAFVSGTASNYPTPSGGEYCHSACKGNDCTWQVCCALDGSGCRVAGPFYLQ